MKLITKNRESIREGLRLFQTTGKMPEITDGAREIMAKIQFIFEQHQTLKIIRLDDLLEIPKKKNRHLKNPEEYDLQQVISVKKQVIEQLIEKFAPITYMQASIDYQFATEIFNFEIFNDASLKLSVAEEECFDSYLQAKANGELGAAEKFMGHYIKIQQAKPPQPQKIEPRATKIIAEWNPSLIKGCEVVETQEELDELERIIRQKYTQTAQKTVSSLFQKLAEDIPSIELTNLT